MEGKLWAVQLVDVGIHLICCLCTNVGSKHSEEHFLLEGVWVKITDLIGSLVVHRKLFLCAASDCKVVYTFLIMPYSLWYLCKLK